MYMPPPLIPAARRVPSLLDATVVQVVEGADVRLQVIPPMR